MNPIDTFDAVIVGGGPAGATAATDLARRGRSVLMLDRAGRIKPCGGAIPPKLLEEFEIPQSLLVTRVKGARIVSPSAREVAMPIDGGFVGMVNRDEFDEWLRQRAVFHGAARHSGVFERISRDAAGGAIVHYAAEDRTARSVRARVVIGADGARSNVARQCIPGSDRMKYVFAYHEIIRAPQAKNANSADAALRVDYDAERCDVVYRGTLSPDFYAWVFPHGDTVSVGTGSAHKGFSMRNAVAELRAANGLAGMETIRREGAPIPMKPLKRWDNGRDVVLAGDAAGVVAPASGEGIYYAMLGGRLAADATDQFLVSGDVRALASARARFMRLHGRVFWVLDLMQRFWYSNDRRRERFVSICRDPDVQKLTWEAYMHKRLVRARPLAHLRIFLKDLAHLTGLIRL